MTALVRIAAFRGACARALNRRTKTKLAGPVHGNGTKQVRTVSTDTRLHLSSVCACYILRAHVHYSITGNVGSYAAVDFGTIRSLIWSNYKSKPLPVK
jgi:hypothetical protein